MKHLTLLIAALFISVGAMAQAVYSSGCFTNSDGLQQAALYLNGERLHESAHNNSSSDALVCNPHTGDVYWVENVDNPEGIKFGNVLKTILAIWKIPAIAVLSSTRSIGMCMSTPSLPMTVCIP